MMCPHVGRGHAAVCVGLVGIPFGDRKSPGALRHNFVSGRPMNTPPFTPQELDQLHALAAQWGKIVSKRAFGDDGPGLTSTSGPWSKLPPSRRTGSWKEP